jgi:hypothetical protein
MISEVLVEPLVGALPNDPLVLSTSFGQIPLLALLTLVVIAALAFIALFKPKGDVAATPYSGGEPYQFDLSGAYFISASGQRKLNDAINALAIFIIALMVLVPLMQEASLWLN